MSDKYALKYTLKYLFDKVTNLRDNNKIALDIHIKNAEDTKDYFYNKGTYMGFDNAITLIRDELLEMLRDCDNEYYK